MMEIDISIRGVTAEEAGRVLDLLRGTAVHASIGIPKWPTATACTGYTGKVRRVGGSVGQGMIGTVITTDPGKLAALVDFGDGPEWVQDQYLDPVTEPVAGVISGGGDRADASSA